MKYATRMVLVPETDYLKRRVNPEKDRKAAIKLSQKLGKKIRQRNQSTARLKGETHPMPTAQISSLYKQARPKQDISKLIEYLTPLYRDKAKLLLAELITQGVTWNDDKELVLPGDKVLPESNIVDLLKEALVGSKRSKTKPKGWNDFVVVIAASSAPLTMFTKKSVLNEISKVRNRPIYIDY